MLKIPGAACPSGENGILADSVASLPCWSGLSARVACVSSALFVKFLFSGSGYAMLCVLHWLSEAALWTCIFFFHGS